MNDPMRKQECLDSAQHWEDLARSEAAWAEYYASAKSPGYGKGVPAVYANRAETYRKVAANLRLEAEDGISRCACCSKPRGEHDQSRIMRGAR